MYSPRQLKTNSFGVVYGTFDDLYLIFKAGFHPSVKIFKRSSLFLPTRKAP